MALDDLIEAGREDRWVVGPAARDRHNFGRRHPSGLLQTGAVKHFADGEEGTRWTYEFQGVRNQIGHILVSRSILDAGAKIHASVPDQDNELASDHRPLVMRLQF